MNDVRAGFAVSDPDRSHEALSLAGFASGVKDPHQLSATSETREFSRCGRGGLRASMEGIPAAVILGSPP